VVVHSNGIRAAALERGAAPDSIFVIPEPLMAHDEDDVSNYFSSSTPPHTPGNSSEARINFFVPEFATADAVKLPGSAELLLEAFALATQEVPGLCLVLEAPESLRDSLNELAVRMGIADKLQLVDSSDAKQAWRECDVVIATPTVPQNVVAAKQPNEVCLQAMLANKPLLAADVPRHRDISPDGRGCLWFDGSDPRDLGHRISFLALNPEFRSALGASGHAFMIESRSLAKIGAQYDAVYRHALSRRKTINTGAGMASFQVSPNFT